MESVMCISEPGCSSYTFAFFVHFNHENCFNPLLEKELVFLHRQILDASTKAFTFSTFCISLSYNMKYYPQLEKNPTLIRDKTKQLHKCPLQFQGSGYRLTLNVYLQGSSPVTSLLSAPPPVGLLWAG